MLQTAAELCYKPIMAKPPTSVRSIRLPDSVWAWIAEAAAVRGMTVNGYVAAALEDARSGPRGPANAQVRPALQDAKVEPDVAAQIARLREVHEPRPSVMSLLMPLDALTGKPLPARKAWNPQPKKGKK